MFNRIKQKYTNPIDIVVVLNRILQSIELGIYA